MKTQLGRGITTIAHQFLFAVLMLTGLGSVAADQNAGGEPFSTVDLQPHYDLFADDPSQFGMWEVVPKNFRVLHNVPYQIGGMIRLYGQIPPPHKTVYRDKVEGIEVGRKFTGLYLLHGTGWTTDNGVEIAQVTVNYADGTRHKMPIVYGEHVRDWWKRERVSPHLVSDPNSLLAWEGEHDGVELRFYQTILFHPHPEKEVRTIEIASSRSAVTPAIVAMTVGPAERKHNRLAAELISPPNPDAVTKVNVKVLDAATEGPLHKAGMNVTFGDDEKCRYLGAYQTDATGVRTLTFPVKPEQLNAVSFSVRADGYTSEDYYWNSWSEQVLPSEITIRMNQGNDDHKPENKNAQPLIPVVPSL